MQSKEQDCVGPFTAVAPGRIHHPSSDQPVLGSWFSAPCEFPVNEQGWKGFPPSIQGHHPALEGHIHAEGAWGPVLETSQAETAPYPGGSFPQGWLLLPGLHLAL